MEGYFPAFQVRSGSGGVVRQIDSVPRMVDSPAEAVRLSLRSASECLSSLEGAGLNPVLRAFKLDESSQSQIRRLMVHLVAGPLEGREQWLEEWRAGRSFLDTLSCVFLEALRSRAPAGGLTKNAVNAELLARLVRAGANLIKWDYLRYGPVERELWAFMGAAYLEAERTGMSQMLVSLRKDRGTQTSVEREYLRALALGCASLDQLAPDSMEIADRLIRYMLPTLRISHKPGSGACFGLQIGAPAAPVRIASGAASEQFSHYFLPAGAGSVCDELTSVIERGLVPAAIASGARARERVLATLFHLRRLWSDRPPMRRHRRHELSARLSAVRGLKEVSARLESGAPPSIDDCEWELRNVSRGGIGLTVPSEQCESLQVGELVGFLMEGGSGWHVGVVRRIAQTVDGVGFVGVELIGREPSVVLADDGRAANEVLLCDPVRQGRTVRLAGPSAALPVDTVVYLNLDGRIVKLKPIALLVRGNEFVLRNYQLL